MAISKRKSFWEPKFMQFTTECTLPAFDIISITTISFLSFTFQFSL